MQPLSTSDRKTFPQKALFAEAFAAHFLTDMFSSAHSRVPRWYIIDAEGTSGADSTRGAIIARVLHQHEGRLGVFLTNSIGQLWYAKGDTHVLDASLVSAFAAPLTPWPNSRETIGYAELVQLKASDQLRPDALAASLVFASLVDVLRHCSKGFTENHSVRGGTGEPSGCWGYILARSPFALSTAGMPTTIWLRSERRMALLLTPCTWGQDSRIAKSSMRPMRELSRMPEYEGKQRFSCAIPFTAIRLISRKRSGTD